MQMQRTILWVVFTMSLLLLWDGWQKHVGNPSMFGANPTAETVTDSTTSTQGESTAGSVPGVGSATDSVAGQASVPEAGAMASAPSTDAATQTPGGIGSAAGSPSSARTYQMRNDVLALEISATGSVIVRAELLQHRQTESEGNVILYSAEPGKFYVAQTGLINAPAGSQFPTHHTGFIPVGEPTDTRLVLAAEDAGLRVEREYSLTEGDYVITVTERLSNTSGETINPVVYRQLTRDDHSPPGDTFFYQTFSGPVIYTDELKFEKIDFDDIIDGSAEHAGVSPDGWLGIIQHYFASAWLPPVGDAREFYTRKSGANLVSVGYKQALPALSPGGSSETSAQLYAGPQDQDVLEKLAPGLELTVDYGFLTVIAKPLYWLLSWLHSIVGNWGWAIVLLTLIIKTIFFPLQAASYRSMARMKAVAPRLTALKERHGDDRAAMNQAMMSLYKTEKINPLGGCLPILVQIPVFISLYWVLQASVEMRDAPWIGWITDLASPDPFYILPLLMAISMFVQVRLNPKPPDPLQAKIMMFMPVAFSVMFFFFPAGLVLYWLVNNLYSIAQQWVITKKILDEKKPG